MLQNLRRMHTGPLTVTCRHTHIGVGTTRKFAAGIKSGAGVDSIRLYTKNATKTCLMDGSPIARTNLAVWRFVALYLVHHAYSHIGVATTQTSICEAEAHQCYRCRNTHRLWAHQETFAAGI